MNCGSAATAPDGKRFLIEIHKRFAYPAACLVLMLVGVPLGVTSRRGGKSFGLVFTILLVFVYYSALAHRHRPGQAELDLRLLCRLVGQPALRRGRHLSALADGLAAAAF